MPTPNKDAEHLDRLRDYYAANRHIPSFQRIADLLGITSKAAARAIMIRLETAGFVEQAPDNKAWIPSARFFELPLAGFPVRAGAPDAIDGTLGQHVVVDQFLFRHPTRTVMVPVKGDSMIDAGIHEGDLVAVERQRAAKAGDLVIAIVDDEFTLKELAQEAGTFVLKPHNPAYPVIRPKGQLEIFGVVTGLVRRYTP